MSEYQDVIGFVIFGLVVAWLFKGKIKAFLKKDD
jgi:hypothetical protein